MMKVPDGLKGNVKEISTGATFSVGVDNDGKVYVWGYTKISNKIDIAKKMPKQKEMGKVVSAITAEPSEILFLNLERLQYLSPKAASCRSVIMQNLLRISVQKNLILSNRIFCTTPKTIRERLLIYLTGQAVRTGSTAFEIPFDRQGMADYLNLDRSALSKELGKMRKEGYHPF